MGATTHTEPTTAELLPKIEGSRSHLGFRIRNRFCRCEKTHIVQLALRNPSLSNVSSNKQLMQPLLMGGVALENIFYRHTIRPTLCCSKTSILSS